MSDIEAACSIEKLSIELLQIIFLEASIEDGWDPCPLDIRAFPWVAGHVSRRWRELALSFPQMWSDVKLRMWSDEKTGGAMTYRTGELTIASSPKAPKILEEYLLRSKNSSITISVQHMEFCDRPRSRPDVSKVLAVLGGHSDRWKSATIYIEHVPTRSLFRQINGRLSRLEKLNWYHSPNSKLRSTIIAPRLRDLDLGDISCIQSFPQWAQLQRIVLHSPTIEDLRVLQGSHQLHHLCIFEDFPDSHDPPGQPDLEFPHICILACPPSILKAFKELPALRELHLGGGQEQLMTTKLFLQRLSLRLIAFTFPSVSEYNPAIVVDILKMLPGLQTLNMLSLSGVMWNAAMDYLELDPERLDDVHLSELEHVEIFTHSQPEIYRCIAMIESRFSVQSDFPQLKSISWPPFPSMTSHDFPDDVKMRLEALRRRGLKVTHY
ncbi:hypothetical protein C8J56DRAFT_287216 [Mycena floridula]|nr:hypothetical protein C8J56DRAFT_287216 [Mycena floridula]